MTKSLAPGPGVAGGSRRGHFLEHNPSGQFPWSLRLTGPTLREPLHAGSGEAGKPSAARPDSGAERRTTGLTTVGTVSGTEKNRWWAHE